MRTRACFCSSLIVWSARMARVRSGDPVGGLEDPGLHVERLGGDAQRLGDLLEDLGRGPAQSPLDLAQVGVGDPGQLGQAPQGQPGRSPLLTDEGPEVEPAIFRVGAHSCKRTAASGVVGADVGTAAAPGMRARLDPGWDPPPFGYGPARTTPRPTTEETAMAEYSLPDLPYDYAALEPHVSAQIMELHHDKHHAAYVTGANQTLEKLAAAPRQGRLRRHRRAREDAGLPHLGPRPALHLLEEPEPRRRRQARRRARLGHRRELRLLRQVQGALHPGHLDHSGLGLGCAGLRAAGRPADRGAGLRPPGQRRATGRSRCSSSTPGSTPSTCSTRT